MALYRHAIAGTRRLTDEEIETELGYHLPSRMSAGLRQQLIDIGRRLYEAEGLSPEVPPPPALCNSIEGARYRDMVARLGQAGNDRNLSISALQLISESLGAIARYAPAIDGELSVPITQFISKPGEAVEAVIAPYFQDNDYNHFKRLRDRLNANFNATHRTTPIYPRDFKGPDVAETP
ncbi:MAG: ATP-binding protein, partial [Alphaproteobacteria bacterium]